MKKIICGLFLLKLLKLEVLFLYKYYILSQVCSKVSFFSLSTKIRNNRDKYLSYISFSLGSLTNVIKYSLLGVCMYICIRYVHHTPKYCICKTKISGLEKPVFSAFLIFCSSFCWEVLGTLWSSV